MLKTKFTMTARELLLPIRSERQRRVTTANGVLPDVGQWARTSCSKLTRKVALGRELTMFDVTMHSTLGGGALRGLVHESPHEQNSCQIDQPAMDSLAPSPCSSAHELCSWLVEYLLNGNRFSAALCDRTMLVDAAHGALSTSCGRVTS